MNFSQEDYSVTLEETKVTLLRKEFHLLKFLYQNKGRAFSRAELLDAVWPLEEPTDRTVDDHIYRLRKKLFPFRNIVQIKTVKGLGYLLKMEEQQPEPFMPVPKEISEHANQLFNTYYKYGQGKALKELMSNQTLGYPLEEKQQTLLWLRSDFESLLENLDTNENKFVPLMLYAYVENDKVKVISTHEKVLHKNILDEKERMDISCFSLPMLYMKVDKPGLAMQLVTKELNAIKTSDHGFLPLLKLMKAMILLYEHKMDEAKEGLAAVEMELKRHPYLREQGAFRVVKGLFHIANGERQTGKSMIAEGIQTIDQTGHTYYFLFIYQILDLLLPKAKSDQALINEYKRQENNYHKTTNLHRLKESIIKHIHSSI
ncbi:winged helix-turn-helix domain-containing protein [Lentibacillus sediminis]|uniref:winged helix-turn-helix domain-containing protein n=1 Tax=Lentibacillus sediminis TaxID=1940529 RepID=UPI00130411E9|nr:winged helix-turn-helix domain-containing protein [Lentibacillus sediminis]